MNQRQRKRKAALQVSLIAALLSPSVLCADVNRVSATVNLSYDELRAANAATYQRVAARLNRQLDAEKINFLDVFLASNEIKCFELWLEGFCLWLIVQVRPWGIDVSVELTFDISHYNPDFVVASYPRVGGSPLLEADLLYSQIQKTVSKTFLKVLSGRDVPAQYENENAFGGRVSDTSQKTISMYSEVDVIGHPGNVITLVAGGVGSVVPNVQALTETIAGVGTAAANQTSEITDTLKSNTVINGSVGDVDQWSNQLVGGGDTEQWTDEHIKPAEFGVAQLIQAGLTSFTAVTNAVAELNSADAQQMADAESTLQSTVVELDALAEAGSFELTDALDSVEPLELDAAIVDSALEQLDASAIESTDLFDQLVGDVTTLNETDFAQIHGDVMTQPQFVQVLSAGENAFKNLNIGSAAIGGSNGVNIGGVFAFCPKDTTPLTPHYLSGLNVLSWRYQLPELAMPQSYAFPVPGSSYFVGKFGASPISPMDSTGQIANWANQISMPNWSTWGNIYPRSGWIAQPDEVKNRALAAFRATHVVTRKDQMHFYNYAQPVDPGNGMIMKWPGPLNPNEISTGAWQMIHPKKTNRCALLQDTPIESPLGVPRDPALTSNTGAYVFNVWRRYQCCPEPEKDGIKRFLGKIPMRLKIL